MKKDVISLSDHFGYKRLFRFVFPSIVMMLFTSVYGIVDGLYISNCVGDTAFAAVNLIFPFTMVLGAVGFMLGAGGSALVSKTLGKGDSLHANRCFSLIVYTAIVAGTVLAGIGIAVMEPVARWMGATDEMLKDAVSYGCVLLIGLPAFMLQNLFQSFLITAEKPKIGLWVTVAAGLTNIVLDAVFVGWFGWGVIGAAAATIISQYVGGVIPLIYFITPKNPLLRLGKTKFMGKELWQTCSNGSSELLSNISMSLVSMLYNYQLLTLVGEDGVSAYGVIMYIQFFFIAIFIGYAIGTAPLFGFNHGAENHAELKNLLRKSMVLMWGTGFVMTITALLLATPLSHVFVGYKPALFELTRRGFLFTAPTFLFCGFCIFGSSFFTALNNGPVSAVISFLRTVVFQVIGVLALPLVFGVDGIFLSLVVAEIAAVLVTLYFMLRLRSRYHYG